jgi:hypothetical protein
MLAPLRLLQRTQTAVASRALFTRTLHVTALKALPTGTRSFSSAAAPAPGAPTQPSAFDVVVQLTFVDPNGARRQVPAYVGKPFLLFVLSRRKHTCPISHSAFHPE